MAADRAHRRLVAVAAALAAAAAVAVAQPRPRIEVADPARACPGITGSFVALLDERRGMLLLSGDEFLGGRPVARSGTGGATLAVAGGDTWALARVALPPGEKGLWGAVYPFAGARADGCVAFDRDRFSSEGDLVTYLRWVVDSAYLSLPAEERQRWPAFRIADREVGLEVRGLGFQPLPLAGREGSTIAFRLPGVGRTYLITPFVLDAATGRVAAFLASTAQEFWQGGEKQPLGVVVAATGSPGSLADPPITVAITSVSGEP